MNPDYVEWYRGQVVLLTGGTGSLGGCLLYKLIVQLPTAKVYVLCRGTVNQAIEKWESSMPEQIDDILDSGKVQCIHGDITKDELGLPPADLQRLRQEVTVVIHAAANISLAQQLPKSIRTDCLPAVHLARTACSFERMQAFVQISSFAQSHLPPGEIKERVVKMDADEPPPESQIAAILATGQSPYTHRFITPYGQSKHLAEQLLDTLDTPFPILIVRPTSIAPAIRDPYPYYGPHE